MGEQSLGFFTIITRRNAIGILIGVELVLNSANINLVAVARYRPDLAGQIFTIFTITVAAAEAAIGLGLVIAMFRNVQTVNVDDVHLLEG